MKRCFVFILALIVLTYVFPHAVLAQTAEFAERSHIPLSGPVYDLGDGFAALGAAERNIVKINEAGEMLYSTAVPENRDIGGLYHAMPAGEKDWFLYTKNENGRWRAYLSAVTKENEHVFSMLIGDADQVCHLRGWSFLAQKDGIVMAVAYGKLNPEKYRLLWISGEGEIRCEEWLDIQNATVTLASDGKTDRVHMFVNSIGDPAIAHVTYDAAGKQLEQEETRRYYAFDLYWYRDGVWYIWDEKNKEQIPLF